MSANRIGVGEVYPGLSFPVPERNEYNYLDYGHELRLFFNSPTYDEVEAVKRGRAELALVVEGQIIFFLYRFSPGIPWSDAPYTIHLVPESRRQIPTESGKVLLTVVLSEAASGIVRAIRATTLSDDFTAALHEAIRDQAAENWDKAEYDRQLRIAYAENPTTETMLARAVETTGGGR